MKDGHHIGVQLMFTPDEISAAWLASKTEHHVFGFANWLDKRYLEWVANQDSSDLHRTIIRLFQFRRYKESVFAYVPKPPPPPPQPPPPPPQPPPFSYLPGFTTEERRIICICCSQSLGIRLVPQSPFDLVVSALVDGLWIEWNENPTATEKGLVTGDVRRIFRLRVMREADPHPWSAEDILQREG
jgi:hypothetical protein